MNDRAKKSEDLCNSIKFSDLCVLFEKIEKTAGSANKLRLLFNKDMKKFLSGQSIFPLLRLVLPLNDTDRSTYGLKQASVAKTYVSALHLDPKTSDDARRLINWKDPSKAHGVEMSKIVVGDFGLILEDVLKSRVRADYSAKTLGEVNELLDMLANSTSTEEKVNIIRNKILNEFNANEQKWLARIIFRDMKIGLKHEQVLSSFYPNALKRYNECTNLRLVCDEEGITSELNGLQVGTKFSPMLAKGFSTSGGGQVAAVEAAMKNDPFVMDIKLDGERMQCHLEDNGHVTLYTRRGNNYTDNYLPLAQIVRDNILIDSPTRGQCQIIIDGEVCAWDIVLQQHMPFGNNLGVAKVERELRETYSLDRPPPPGWDRNLPACMFFIAFDIVYFDGPDSGEIIDAAMEECGIANRFVETGEITNLPLAVRRKILAKILHPVPNRFDTVKSRTVLSTDVTERRQQIEVFFNEVTVEGEEGLVIKNLSSTYELGEKSRATGSWVKMKPEYGDQTEDLDLLILGAYYGEGRGVRGEGLSTFLCGVRDDTMNSSGQTGYRTLCKVGTGYSFDELRELREKLRPFVVPWREKNPPDHLAHWNINKRDDRPNVWIPPENSVVVQLKCAELVDSNAFSAGLTCRFPRLQRIRYDKAPQEIMKLSEVLALKDQVRDTTHQTMEKTQGVSKKGKKKDTSVTEEGGVGKKRVHAVDNQFRISNKKVSREGFIFEGMVFCVLENEFVYGKDVDFSTSGGGSGQSSNTSTQMSALTQTQASPSVTQLFATQPTQNYAYSSQDTGVSSSAWSGSGGSSTTVKTEPSNVRRYTREELINEIKSQGGEVVASPTLAECKIIAGNKRTFQLNNYIERGDRDVLDFSYVVECLEAGELLPPKPVHYLGYSANTRKQMVGLCNPFGESYTEDTTPADLQKIFLTVDSVINKTEKEIQFIDSEKKMTAAAKKKAAALVAATEQLTEEEVEEGRAILRDWNDMKNMSWRELSSTYLLEEEREPVYYSKLNCMWSDRTVIYLDAYFDLGSVAATTALAVATKQAKHTLNDALIDASNTPLHASVMKALYHRLLAYGAVVSDALNGAVTHVIVIPENKTRLADIKDRIRLLRTLDAHSYEKPIVSPLWAERAIYRGYMDEPAQDEIIQLN